MLLLSGDQESNGEHQEEGDLERDGALQQASEIMRDPRGAMAGKGSTKMDFQEAGTGEGGI